MAENELTIGKESIFVGGTIPEGLEHLGNMNYPCAQVDGKIYQYLYTCSNRGSAEKVIKEESGKKAARACVTGLAVDLTHFFNTGDVELESDESAVGVWAEVGDIPGVFQNLKN